MSRNVEYVRCVKCQRILKCSPNATDTMMKHIKRRHAEVFEDESTDAEREQPKQQQLPKTDSNDKIKNLHKMAKEHGISEERLAQISKLTGLSESEMADEAERYISKHNSASLKAKANELNKLDSKEIFRRKSYRTTMHQWEPPDGRIYCPRCDAYKRPIIQTRAQLQGSCAAWLRSCWPFCCLPCFIPDENHEYLHCLKCKNFLGIYYREKRCLRPNRNYSECPGVSEKADADG